MNDASEILVERDGAIVTVTINREARLNSLGHDTHLELERTWRGMRDDPSVRAIIITGAGTRAFCTGMDVKENAERGGHQSRPDIQSVDDFGMTPLQHGIWAPVIVAVNGLCVGGGLHFVSQADVVIASANASFLDTHAQVGQVFALEPTELLPRIGLGNALRMTVLGRAGRLSAADALRVSLVHEVVEPDQLMARARELAEAASLASPRAIELSKRAIWGALDRPFREALQNGWEILLEHRDHPDYLEGPRAFAERRPPRWADDTPPA